MIGLRGFIALIVLVAATAAGSVGCDSAPCEQAADKIEQCLQRLDCRDADPQDISKCRTAEQKGNDALPKLRDLPCTLQLRDIAHQINDCPISQVKFCNCITS